jgi:hypothetical protein
MIYNSDESCKSVAKPYTLTKVCFFYAQKRKSNLIVQSSMNLWCKAT